MGQKSNLETFLCVKKSIKMSIDGDFQSLKNIDKNGNSETFLVSENIGQNGNWERFSGP